VDEPTCEVGGALRGETLQEGAGCSDLGGTIKGLDGATKIAGRCACRRQGAPSRGKLTPADQSVVDFDAWAPRVEASKLAGAPNKKGSCIAAAARKI